MAIKNVLLDVDDTLFDYQKAEAIAIRKALIQLEIEPDERMISRHSAINEQLWKLLEEKKMTREQVLTKRFDLLFAEFDVVRSSTKALKIYQHLFCAELYFIPGALELLKTLHRRYDLYIVSNGNALVQDTRIKNAGIASYFKGIFISQRIGFDKPHPAFFDCCFASIPDFSKEETIIIGDSLSADMKGGNNAGIYTCWFNSKGKERVEGITVHYEVADLHDIPDILLQL